MEPSAVDQVRRFNRLVTRRVGALEDSYLSRGRPLGEARLLFEAGLDGADLSDLRAALGLNSGYMSRLLRSLTTQGLIEVVRQEGDARRRQVRLTGAGRAEFSAYDKLSNDLAQSMLAPLNAPERERLLAAMNEVERLIQAGAVEVRHEPAASADARQCLAEYFRELAARFEAGFDPAKGNEVSAAEMTPPAGWFFLARTEGKPAGCGALLRIDETTGEIKRMWTAPFARGRGVAQRIIAAIEATARAEGMTLLRLDTNKALKEAHALYRKLGFEETERYSANPYAHHWFRKRL